MYRIVLLLLLKPSLPLSGGLLLRVDVTVVKYSVSFVVVVAVVTVTTDKFDDDDCIVEGDVGRRLAGVPPVGD